MAPEVLLDQLHAVARREHLSLAEVIRQGLEWRVSQPNRKPRCIGSGRSTEEPHDLARRAGDLPYAPRSWR